MARGTCLVAVGIIVALFGAAALILGLYVTPKELPIFVRDQLNNYVIVDSSHAEGYSGWAGQNDVENPYYMVLYMFNLTNMGDVVNYTATPVYEQVGPYMYRRYRRSANVTFLQDGDLVQYSDFYDWIFDANASGSLSESDMITNINPVYVGALMQAPGGQLSPEQSMYLAATGGMIQSFTNYFTGPFITLFTALKFPGYFDTVMEENIVALNATYGNTQQSYDAFLDIWCNSTTTQSAGNWTGVLLSTSTPSGISYNSAQLLLSATPFSLLDDSYEAAWYWDQSISNPVIAKNLTSTFGITTSQLALLWNWRNSVFGPVWMFPSLISTYGLDQMSDLGWVQFITETPLGGNSAFDVFPNFSDLGFYTELELATYVSNADLTWRQWRSIFSNTAGLENVTNFQNFMLAYQLYQNNNAMDNFTEWGMSNNTNAANGIFGYLVNLVQIQTIPVIQANMGETGGLFVTRTVNQWAINCDDFLLNLLREIPPICSFKYNNTAMAPNIINTGKSDINQINTYTTWEGQTQLDYWQYPMNISGFTELGQFVPGHTDRTPYPVFQQDTARIIFLNYTTNVTVEGIQADRYILDFNKTFGVSEFFGQSIQGLANLTNLKSGSPIFTSLWDLLYVPNATDMVVGLNQTNELEENTLIDIEPTTGITVQCRRRMQVNVYVPNNNQAWYAGQSLIPNNQDFTSGIVYPLAKVGEYATISEANAAQLKAKLGLPPRVKHITFYIGVTAGPVLVVIGICLIFLARRHHHHHHHHHHDERTPLTVNRH